MTDEVVIAVEGDGYTVVTRRGRTTTRYYGVTARVRVGAVLEQPLPHERRQVIAEWSPFDAPGDEAALDDEINDPDVGRRTF